jgi:uncharacterized protein YhbP (UPF0306 family)
MTKQNTSEPNPTEAELRSLAAELIQKQSVVTLATSAKDQAWAAPVYYVYHKSGFCFFSDPGTRHVSEALEGGQASASVHAPSFDWREIRGLQMSGRVEHVSGKIEALGIIGAYLKKFSFIEEFFTPGNDLDMAAFESRFRVKLYKFTPSLAYYLDNKIRFGFREEVSLE